MKTYYRAVAGVEVFHRMVSDPQVASDLAFYVTGGSTSRVSTAATDIQRMLQQLRSAIPYTFERKLADTVFSLGFDDKQPPPPGVSIPPLIAPAIWIGFETPIPLSSVESLQHEQALNVYKHWERGEVLGFLVADDNGTPVVFEFVSDGRDPATNIPLWLCRYTLDESSPPVPGWCGPRDYFPWRIAALIGFVQDPIYDIVIEQIKTSYGLRREREQTERRTKTNLSGLTTGYTVRLRE